MSKAVSEQQRIGKIRDRTWMLAVAFCAGMLISFVDFAVFSIAPSGLGLLYGLAHLVFIVGGSIYFVARGLHLNHLYTTWKVQDERPTPRKLFWGWKFALPLGTWYGA